MAIHDEIREQQKKLKGKSFKEKLGYFWDYYKIHTIVILFITVFAGTFIYDVATAKEEAFSATLLNAYGGERQNDFQNDFAGFAGIDTEIYDCFIDANSALNLDSYSQTDMAVLQRTVAMTQTSGLDILTADLKPFTHFASSGMFLDLRDILPEEEYARYEPYFYYIDQAALDKESEANDFDSAGPESVPDIDHTDPSAMESPIPVGIYLPGSAKLKEYNCYTLSGETPILGFAVNSERPDTALQFLHYLTE